MHTPPSSWRRRLATGTGLAASLLVLTACSEGEASRGLLPEGKTDVRDDVYSLWNGAWIAGLIIGALVVALLAIASLRYRRRRHDSGLPEQVRYHVPLEILYTVVPILMVGVLFTQTVKTEQKLSDTSKPVSLTVNVVGKQWSWDFNYLQPNVHLAGVQAQTYQGKTGEMANLPTLYLPVNERTEFVLTSRDVIHSFWVPAFLQKLDVVPGRVNKFAVTPVEKGEYIGKCAELCGAYHSEMLFKVRVVDRAEFDKQMQLLRDSGNSGILGPELNRERTVAKDIPALPTQNARK